jgi:penicillin-binding protein 2
MIAVNEAGGTGENAKLGDGKPVLAGKTGVSQGASRGSDVPWENNVAWEKRDHALFIGYEPAEAPRYAIATVIEHGGGDGATAALLARDIFKLAIDRDAAAPGKTGSQGGMPTQSGDAQGAG